MPVVLGEGRWGPVFKAFNTDLRCYAALRVIAPAAFANDEARESFVREARLAAHVRHASLAAVFPLEIFGDQYGYATEYVPGETLLTRLIRANRFELLPALRVIGQIAEGLEVASSAGLLHRGITPSNVMLAEEDQEIAAKLLDLALPDRAAQETADKFSSPEECEGREIDVPSGVYSLGAILCYALVGAEKYRAVRVKSLAGEQVVVAEADLPLSVASILERSFCYNPKDRIATFAKLREALDAVLPGPRRFRSEVVERSVPPEYAAQTRDLPLMESSPRAVTKKPSTSASLRSAAVTETRGLRIPSKLLGLVQPGTTLTLSRHEQEKNEIVICSRDRFRVGRSATAGADLVLRCLPRNSVNDAKTRRLSRIHVTAQCMEQQLFLSDGDGVTPSANGSTFAGQALSIETTVPLLESGELRLDEVYSIKVLRRTFETGSPLSIVNLADWRGPADQTASLLPGAVVFVPVELNHTSTAVWLFTVAAFGSTKTSPIDFAQSTESRETGALHYFRGCFWIESRSAHAILLEGVDLAPAEIAPLVAGHTLEITGARYSLKIDALRDPIVRH